MPIKGFKNSYDVTIKSKHVKNANSKEQLLEIALKEKFAGCTFKVTSSNVTITKGKDSEKYKIDTNPDTGWNQSAYKTCKDIYTDVDPVYYVFIEKV